MDLQKLIRLLTPLMVEGVIAVRSNSHARLAESLEDLPFVTRSIIHTPNDVVIKLQILDEEVLHRLLAGEANKFLLASRVSNERSKYTQPNNASWQAIESYYAAYYAVHYLLRLTGISVTNLDTKGTDAIAKGDLGSAVRASIPGGLYFMQYEDNSKTLTLKKNLNKNGGSHREAWQLWTELIEKLRFQTSVDLVEYLSISIDLLNHRNFLIKSKEKFNPPEIRGEINYQFKGKTWIFESNAKDAIDRLQRLIVSSHSIATTPSSSAESLVLNNKIIVDFAKTVFLYAANKYPKGICRSLSNKYSSLVI
jgi:hypothetical protein